MINATIFCDHVPTFEVVSRSVCQYKVSDGLKCLLISRSLITSTLELSTGIIY